MADNCCDPIILPPCVTRCEKLIDACCVVNVASLPCLFPPIETTGGGLIGQFVITVSDVTGIEVGMVAASVATGIASGAVVTKIEGLVVTLDLANVATFPGAASGVVTFTRVEILQCEINEAVDTAICNIEQGITPCHTFTDVTFADSWENYEQGSQEVQYSDVLNCTVRLRGVAAIVISAPISPSYSLNLFTLPAGRRPAFGRIFSPNARVKDSPVVVSTKIYPAILGISAAGLVSVEIRDIDTVTFDGSIQIMLPLDGIFFEVAPL